MSKDSSSMVHPSLPARPPPPAGVGAGAFKSQHGGSGGSGASGGRAAPFFTPRSVATASSQKWQANNNTGYSAGPAPPAGYGTASPGYGGGYNGAGFQQQPPAQQQQGWQQQAGYEQTLTSPPQMVNPFPLPGQEPQRGKPAFDPEYEAQLAQWNSAYLSKEDMGKLGGSGRGTGAASAGGANAIPLSNNRLANTAPPSDIDLSAVSAESGVASVVTGKDGKRMTVVRSGGGKTWQDPSLLEWDPAHFRLFVGNLAGEVTDDSLHKAFLKYGSLQKARVVREKRTSKSKGFGFVSFSEPDDYFAAFKEMQGKYVGSHPVVLRPSTTEIKQTKANLNNAKNKKGKGPNGILGANTGAGVQKKQPKQKGASMKLLG